MNKKITLGIIFLLISLVSGCAPEQKVYVQEDLSSIYSKLCTVGSPLTDLQKETYWNGIKDKLIKDSITVEFVEQSFGRYHVADTRTLIYVRNSEKDKLLSLSKGQKITFEGRLVGYSYWGGYIKIEDAILIE